MSERQIFSDQFQADAVRMSDVERFFENNIDILVVSKEDFLAICKNRWSDMKEEEILQVKAFNFEQDGKVIILVRDDIYPKEFLPYLETHEKWEAYVARKKGYNLFEKSVREYSQNKGVDLKKEDGYKQFSEDLGVYNYDFRHEYAVLKEYEQALADSKLDEYHTWVMGQHQQEKETTDNKENFRLIENDMKIRESIYQKLKNKEKHFFNRQ